MLSAPLVSANRRGQERTAMEVLQLVIGLLSLVATVLLWCIQRRASR
jgi:hypothetical protein